SIYVFEAEVRGDRNCDDRTTMNMTLRPGEAITWRWGHRTPLKHHGQQKPDHSHTICNGLWEYQPDVSKVAAGSSSTWTMKSPYVFVGGRIEADAGKWSICFDGKTWEDAGPNLDKHFPPEGIARY